MRDERRMNSWPGQPVRPRMRPQPRNRHELRRIIALALAWVALLIWPTPQIGAYLSDQSSQLARQTDVTLAQLADRGMGILPGATAQATSTSAHAFWQVGLTADGVQDHDTGMRTTITTLLPEHVSAGTTDYFWVGSYLADGSFIQAGYYVSWSNNSAAGYFYCAFDPQGKEGPCQFGPAGSAGDNATPHTYTLEASGNRWSVQVDGVTVGGFAWSSGDTGASVPVVYAESSGFSAHAAVSQLGPVSFSGIDVRPAGSSAYITAPHVRVIYSDTNVCPPYGAARDGHGGALLGSGLPCPERWSTLW